MDPDKSIPEPWLSFLRELEAGKAMLELGVQGGRLHKKYKIYLDPVGVAHAPEDYEERLTEIFPKTFQHLRLCA
jgi:hypothetical protein